MVWNYLIEVPVAVDDTWFPLCRCLTAEALAEVIRVLMSKAETDWTHIRITRYAVSGPAVTSLPR